MSERVELAVVGTGAAGLMAAIHACEQVQTLLVTDGPLGRSNSTMAQGGLQLPLVTEESMQSLAEDMTRSARVEVDGTRIDRFVRSVGDTVQALEDWGLGLDRDSEGRLVRKWAGGLSEPRIVSVRDQIGPALIRTLRRRVEELEVPVWPHHQVVDLHPREGSLVLELETSAGEEKELEARAVVCCTGGLSYWKAMRDGVRTTNPSNDNHVLVDVLVKLGLEQVHAELYQFQPFGIAALNTGTLDQCVPESIVNFPVRLLDRHRSEICPIRQDRRALTERIFEVERAGDAVPTERGGHGVWLTLSEVEPKELEHAFPKVFRILERAGVVGEDILVYPFLHYQLGGFRVGPRCETSIPGLFLAGEMVGGIHGANRLMGNGITDSLVHGRIAGIEAARYVSAKR